jgi:hypothetical protein
LESKSILLSNTPNGQKIRANITELDVDQIDKIVDSIKDAGPEALEYLRRKVDSAL